ncbi:DNA cytosine methyltransferase [Paraburkholderia caribensis]|uniref:DNA cytosine methyltransferase n=1 Tax=Paraburkholderia caribensis TaxID=75105 RepID=UPI00285FBA81|nr:DNA (cytosine-5-)-methyltransferase [Paraburkholderia caribensis]MDR6384956.1 DNA (cytosine-5)-methyltransferase 1 [Paraburkholderia caribensis]
MRYLSVFAGIEAATVAWRPFGWSALAFAEIDAFPCAVLAHHYPEVPNYGDVKRFARWPDADPDVLVGGSPCQSFSVAGLRKGLDDPRGNLMLTFLAVARRYAPRWLVWENVPGVLSSDGGRDFGTFLCGLAELGYGFAYRVLDAQFFGLAQRRRRVFVVGCLGDWRRAAAVLFERDCLLGHPAPRRETGQDITGTLSARTRSGGGLGTDTECDGALIPDIARSLTSSNERIDAETETLLVAPGNAIAYGIHGETTPKVGTDLMPTLRARSTAGGSMDVVAHALRCEGFDASEDGTGRGTPLVPIAFDTTQITSAANVSHPRAGDPCHPLASRAHAPAIAFDCKASGKTRNSVSEVPGSLRGDGFGGGHAAVAFPYTLAIRGRDNGRNLELRTDDVANALITPNGGRDGLGVGALMIPALQVRRLTPRECARLMGFPDDYTLIPLPRKARQTRVRWSSDGARYRALGNSITVPVLSWLGRRIEMVDALPRHANGTGA